MIRNMFSVLLLALIMSTAQSQVPTVDLAAIAKAVQQLEAWKIQYRQMLDSINLAKGQLESITGKRNLGAILDNVGVNATVPADVVSKWKSLTTQEGLILEALKQTEIALTATTKRSEQIRGLMDAVNSTADTKAVGEIQARMTAEVANVMNDLQRIQLMADQRLVNQERLVREHELRETQRNKKPRPTY